MIHNEITESPRLLGCRSLRPRLHLQHHLGEDGAKMAFLEIQRIFVFNLGV